MAANGLQITGLAVSVIGWICTIISCILPMWRVTAFIGTNIVTAEVFWEGLWMNCVHQSTGQLQCKIYDSLLDLSQDLQAARALMIISIIVAALALLVAIVGAKCTSCVEDESVKARISIAAGITYIIAAIVTLIPVSWTANTIIRDFYNPLVLEAQKRELGASLYIGWASSAFLLTGGALLCCSCPPTEQKYPVKYLTAKSAGQSSYAFKQYV
ncbi:claudin-4-like [Latimeria chalumnae]|uniref:Claudin n=1 Tax=Latimeria chalumnae TaxID=7897 RepID=H3AW95_LATCH|nr:PREDICTED: claudin-4-like [Latimeria chalumnae]|eukprot:XP_005992322.1 PREDICTED: claudin-4-like [Latimeria chalumnae]